MNNVPSLESRIETLKKSLSDDSMDKINELVAAKSRHVQSAAQCDEMIKSLASKQQEKMDLATGLDILSKIKSGKFVLFNTDTLEPVDIKFM